MGSEQHPVLDNFIPEVAHFLRFLDRIFNTARGISRNRAIYRDFPFSGFKRGDSTRYRGQNTCKLKNPAPDHGLPDSGVS
jgi:hypothetical protein